MDRIVEVLIEFLCWVLTTRVFREKFIVSFSNLSQVIIVLVNWAVCPDPLLLNGTHDFEEAMEISCHKQIYLIWNVLYGIVAKHDLQICIRSGMEIFPPLHFFNGEWILLLQRSWPGVIWLFWLGLYWFWFSSVGVFLIGHILSWCYVSCCRLSCYWGLFLFLKFCIRVVLRVRILFWFLVRYCWSCVNNFLWDLVDLSFFFLFLFLRNINWTEWFPVALSFLSGNKLFK